MNRQEPGKRGRLVGARPGASLEIMSPVASSCTACYDLQSRRGARRGSRLGVLHDISRERLAWTITHNTISITRRNEKKIKHEKEHEKFEEKQVRTMHPAWFAIMGSVLIFLIIFIWIWVAS